MQLAFTTPTASLERHFSSLSLRPTISLPIYRHAAKPNHPNHLRPTNYSFKVVFRDFRIIHSVPVKPLLCSDWNIQSNVPAGTREL
jgi:hypothetical protein